MTGPGEVVSWAAAAAGYELGRRHGALGRRRSSPAAVMHAIDVNPYTFDDEGAAILAAYDAGFVAGRAMVRRGPPGGRGGRDRAAEHDQGSGRGA